MSTVNTKTAADDSYTTPAGPVVDMDLAAEAQKLADGASGGAQGGLVLDPKKMAWALVLLGQQLIGVTLYDYQLEPAYRILYSLLARDGAEVTMLFSRQSGKSEVVTFCIIMITVWFPMLGKFFPELDHFKDGVKVGLFAPQMDQVETVYNRCMDRMHSPQVQEMLTSPDINDRLLSKVNFKLKNGSFVKAQSGAKQSKIESKTYHIVFIDESQDMDTQKVRKSIIPMTASTFGTIIRIGTPNRVKGDFFYTIQNNKNKDRKHKHQGEQRLHFEYNAKRVIEGRRRQYDKDKLERHLLYEKAVARDRQSMGKNSEEFRMSYELEWLFDVGMFITDAEFNAKMVDARLTWPKRPKGAHMCAGLDIASARAQTVLTLGMCEFKPEQEFGSMPTKTVADWMALDGSYEEQYPQIEEFLIANNVAVLYADYTGVGRAVTDRLIANLGRHIEIVPFTFTPLTKSDMWKALEEEINAGRLVVPGRPDVKATKEFKDFEEQMLNLQREWHGKLMVCGKTQGHKDDYPDSLGLMNLAGNHVFRPMKLEVQQGNFFTGGRGGRYDSVSY